MAKDRLQISEELAAEVMFASDRTCCVCRVEKLKVQIHHIDGDPSHNNLENLAVICLICHSEAHTNGAFVRNLTPQLIRNYNANWREMVKIRFRPSPDSADKLVLAAEAFLQASMDSHRWRIWFMDLLGSDLPDGKPGGSTDVWEVMVEDWLPKYSKDTYHRFKPLFTEGLTEIQRRFDRITQLFSDVIPLDFRAVLIRANRRLESEQRFYLKFQYLGDSIIPATDREKHYHGIFAGVIQVLREVARDAEQRNSPLTTVQLNSPIIAP